MTKYFSTYSLAETYRIQCDLETEKQRNNKLEGANILLKDENEDLDKRLYDMYDLFTEAADAGDVARADVHSLRDALDMKQVSHDAIDKEVGELRQDLAAAKKELKEVDITVDILRADCCTLRQELYVKSYPSEDLIKAKKELDELRAKVKELEQFNAVNYFAERQGILNNISTIELDQFKATLKEAGLKLIELAE
jgi:cell division protein FtsB